VPYVVGLSGFIVGLVGVIVGAVGLTLAARNYAHTWPGRGLHVHTGTNGIANNGLAEYDVAVRLRGSAVVYEASFATWGISTPTAQDDAPRPRLDCTSPPFETTVHPAATAIEEAWVGLKWTEFSWGRPSEHAERFNLGNSAYERWEWSRSSRLSPRLTARGRWRPVKVTKPGKLREVEG